jgi:very-short-patch-repair endonuclease
MHTSADDPASAASIIGADPRDEVHQDSKSFEDERRALADAKIEALRRKLLDLSLANRLLSFRHSETSRTHIRIVDELPEVVLSKLQEEISLTFRAVPLPPTAPDDEDTEAFQQALETARLTDADYLDAKAALGPRPRRARLAELERDLRNRVRVTLGMPAWEPPVGIVAQAKAHGIDPSYDLPLALERPAPRHSDDFLQTLLYPDQMDAKLAAIRSAARTLEQDAGITALYTAIGFLEWYESRDSREPHFAPLLFVPVDLEKHLARGVYVYRVAGRGDDVEVNVTLAEKLRQDFGLELPAWDDERPLATYFADVERLAAERDDRWRIRRWVTVGVFTFSRLVMYRDLAHQGLREHPILLDLFTGSGRPASIERAQDYDIDCLESSQACPLLVTDADTSQHSALVDALEGRNLVIEGPPGTGKSQTITNLIAAAMFEGKTVLFVAEKMAALEVVKNRLDGFGLGDFCLELHSSSRTRKSTVLAALQSRINRDGVSAEARTLTERTRHREEKRAELRAYAEAMNELVGRTSLTVHDIVWGYRRREEHFTRLPSSLRSVRLPNATALDPEARRQMIEYGRIIDEQLRTLAPWGRSDHPWRGVSNDGLGSWDVDAVVAALSTWRTSLTEILGTLGELSDSHGWRIGQSVNAVRAAVGVRERLPVLPSFFSADLAAALAHSSCRASVRDWCAASTALRQATDAITKYFDVDRVRGAGCDHVTDLATKAASAGIGDCTLSALRDRVQAARADEQSAEELGTIAERLSQLFGIDDPSLGVLRQMGSALRLLRKLPSSLLALRSPGIVDERHIAILHNAARTARELLQAGARLRGHLDLTDVTAVQLRAAAATVRGSTFFSRLTSGDYRAALRLHRVLSGGRKARREEVLRDFDRAASHLAALGEFEADAAIRAACGEHFQGIHTTFDPLLRVADWAREVRSALPPASSAAEHLRALLLSGGSDQLERVAATVAPDAVDRLTSLLDANPADVEVTVTAMVEAARSRSRLLEDILARFEELGPHNDVHLGEVAAVGLHLAGLVEAEARVERNVEGKNVLKTTTGHSLESVQSMVEFVEALAATDLPDSVVRLLLSEPERLADLRERLNTARTALEHAERTKEEVREALGLDFDEWLDGHADAATPLPDVIGRIDRALEHPGALPSYSAFLRAVNQAARGGLGPILAAYDTARVDYHDLSTAVDACVFQSLAREVVEADSRLRSHAGATHDAVKARFQELDREILELHRRQLASTLLAKPVPSGNGVGPKSQWTELALLQHQVSLKRSTLPMRALFTRAGAAIQTLKPCFMMSPMSVAQHLPGGALHFDIVIMDEASQLRPEDALGAIARGRQVVVVGDPQQLPPTSFFEKLETDAVGDDEEEDDTRALESILDLALASFRPVRRLKWHYRSEHPSLIAFSNHEFYSDDPLIIFPSPFASHPDRGVRLVEVDGIYSNRRNDAEASAIVEEAAELMRRRPDVSLGIVALNQPQRELLEAKLDALFAADPAAEAYRQRRTRSLEPLFVKNLENVQGDERDVIFISTVYGRNEEGALFQRFGPINSATGHRRLNVLFTRAKQQVVIFSSLRPGDIRIEETTRRGVRVLRAYLEFAKSGALTQPEFTSREPDSDFERWFISRLGHEGFEVVPQLGVAGFFLDIAIRHPDEPGTFILGVECDGRTYHSSRSARDRDRLRQKILEDRGWQLHRVWSTDWFRNPEYEFKRLVDRIRALRTTGRAVGNGR